LFILLFQRTPFARIYPFIPLFVFVEKRGRGPGTMRKEDVSWPRPLPCKPGRPEEVAGEVVNVGNLTPADEAL
jgi:hypothetical protein